jgi:hypothetical protein
MVRMVGQSRLVVLFHVLARPFDKKSYRVHNVVIVRVLCGLEFFQGDSHELGSASH